MKRIGFLVCATLMLLPMVGCSKYAGKVKKYDFKGNVQEAVTYIKSLADTEKTYNVRVVDKQETDTSDLKKALLRKNLIEYILSYMIPALR